MFHARAGSWGKRRGPSAALVAASTDSKTTTPRPTDRKAEVMAAYYVVVYLGVALPAVGVGAAASAVGLLDAVQAFAAAVIAAAGVLALARAIRTRRSSPTAGRRTVTPPQTTWPTGYSYGTGDAARSPLRVDDLYLLKPAAGFTREDDRDGCAQGASAQSRRRCLGHR